MLSRKSKCAVIDPSDDVERYLAQAENDFSDISAIIDTHIHGDHISGARRLVQKKLGAPICMNESSDVKFDFEAVSDGDKISVGTIILKAIFTPGHTRESMSLLYIDRKRVDSPWGVFSGDTLFVGDIGRLDFSGARDHYANVQFSLR